MAKSTTHVAQRPVSSKIMEAFWMLADVNQEHRTKAVNIILNSLKEGSGWSKKDDFKDLPQDLLYVLKRLVQGIFSDRLLARVGYSTSLVILLNEYENISTKKILNLYEEQFKEQKMKHDDVAALIGEVFIYSAILRSKRCLDYRVIESSNTDTESDVGTERESLVQIVSALWQLKSKRPYITTLCYEVFTSCAEKLSRKQFKSLFWKVIKGELSNGWSQCTQELLCLLLVCERNFPKLINDEFLRKNWQISGPIIQESTLSKVLHILTKGSSSHLALERHLNSRLARELCNTLAKDNNLWQTFWIQHVQGSIFHVTDINNLDNINLTQVKHGEMVLALARCGLDLIKDLNSRQVKCVFSNVFTRFLLTHSGNKRCECNVSAKKLLTAVLDVMKHADTTAKIQLDLISVLLQSTINFDELSKTKTITNCVKSLKLDAAREFHQHLLSFFYTAQPFGVKYSTEDKQKLWVIQQMKSLATNEHVKSDKDLSSKILLFLFLHAFYTITKLDLQILEVNIKSTPPPLNKECTIIVESTFWNILTHYLLQFYRNPSDEKFKMFKILMQKVKSYQASRNLQVKSALTKEALQVFGESEMKVMALGNEIILDEDVRGLVRRVKLFFFPLTICLMYEMYVAPEQMITSVNDVWMCYDKCMKEIGGNKKRKKPGEDLHWSCVTVDLILSLLEQSKFGLQQLLPEIFKSLMPCISTESFNLIVERLTNETTSEEEDDDDDMETSNENGAMDDEDEDNESEDDIEDDDDDDDEDDNEKEETVDEDFLDKLKSALGPAAHKQVDDEDSDSSDLDDETMMKLDEVLAELFKSKFSKARSEKQSILLQIRCVHLLEEGLLSSNTIMSDGQNPKNVDMLLSCIEPMLQLGQVRDSEKLVERRALAQNANSFLMKMTKLKLVPSVKINIEEALKLIKELMLQSARAFQFNQDHLVCELIIFMHKVTLHSDEKEDGKVKDLISQQLKSLLRKWLFSGSHRIHDNVFITLCKRLPSVMYTLLLDITSYIYSNNVSVRLYRRTQLCNIFLLLVTERQVAEFELGDDVWQNCCQNIVSTFKTIVNDGSIKPNYVTSLLSVVIRLIRIDQLVFSCKIFCVNSSILGPELNMQVSLFKESQATLPTNIKTMLKQIRNLLDPSFRNSTGDNYSKLSKRQRKRQRDKKGKISRNENS